MKTINSVLVTVPFEKQHKNELERAIAPASIIYCDSRDGECIDKALETVDVAIISSNVTEQFLNAKNLKWVHCDMAGLTGSASPAVLESGLIVTGSAGRTAQTLSEHVIMFMLGLTYDVYALHDQQKKRIWGGIPNYEARRGLVGKTAGIIGLGNLGKELARKLKAFDMRVLGYRRSNEKVDNVDLQFSAVGGDSIDQLLIESDFVILATALTDQTYHMIGKHELSLMKTTAYLINICRGSVVDENALIDALNMGAIAGAGVDTTETEPLPKESKLWNARNIMITPHITPTVPDRLGNSLKIIIDNIKRYKNNESMNNLLREEDVFSQ